MLLIFIGLSYLIGIYGGATLIFDESQIGAGLAVIGITTLLLNVVLGIAALVKEFRDSRR